MKLKIIIIIFLIFTSLSVRAETSLALKLSGRILLQVESAGEAWYVNPVDGQKYYLGRPLDAFNLMRSLGLGISEIDFNKLSSDENLRAKLSGRIILQVESAGEAWYINPVDEKKYYLGRPADAFRIMKQLALGITDINLVKIPVGKLLLDKPPITPLLNQDSILAQAADSIRNNNLSKTESFFIPEMKKAITYTMATLNSESKLLLANILSNAKLETETNEQKIYSTEAFFSLGGYNVPLHFYVNKQSNGDWLMTNL